MTTLETPTRLDLTGLTTGPAQVWGGVRLVPLLRERPIEDLRLSPRAYGEAIGLVDVDGRRAYAAYIPHGYVASWTRDGSPAASYGTQLADGRTAGTDRAAPVECLPLHFHRRMARRERGNRLRFLPLHLAVEGYLALHFGGPTIVWDEWARRAVNRGLSPRVERAEWAAFHDETLAGGLLGPEYAFQRVYRLGRFSLWRFLPPFQRRAENHIGECVLDSAGRLAYLKTFRLSEAQVRRGHLLDSLAAHDWHLADTAGALGITTEQLAQRVEHAGFGALLVHRRSGYRP
ncbi:ARPP-2 domain-containing protein [Streptomyces hainanensis]|uniref:ARG and Rhodanese-Phosphatase-superfamily-associated domain-containing protein n=1 Tax=Streptomyces hainanensis TaxID=402648 RepID=A0A4R4T9Z4_9ACTN|nr:hypothetical protein [Streptomyces hainanensis]TDC73950.1 hypothetical protein E1283_17505 [Streptomyces hainanensis]